MLLLRLAECLAQFVLLGELGYETVEDGVGPADGARAEGHVLGERVAVCVALDLVAALDEKPVAGLEVLLVDVKQAELLLRDLFLDLNTLDQLVKHLEQLEACCEGGVVLEGLVDD